MPCPVAGTLAIFSLPLAPTEDIGLHDDDGGVDGPQAPNGGECRASQVAEQQAKGR